MLPDNIPEFLEQGLPETIREIAREKGVLVFVDNPDVLEKRLEKWHQFGLLTHTKRIREAFLNEINCLLKNWGLYHEVQKVLSDNINSVGKIRLLEISILLHDLGKIAVYGNSQEDRKHESYSKQLLYEEPVLSKLKSLGIDGAQMGYISRCIETHNVLGKKVRDKLKHNGNLNFPYLSNEECRNICKRVAREYYDVKTEAGIFFICDCLGKTDLRINAKNDEEIKSKEPEIVKELRKRGLSDNLKYAVMQLPLNLKLGEVYLKTLFNQ